METWDSVGSVDKGEPAHKSAGVLLPSFHFDVHKTPFQAIQIPLARACQDPDYQKKKQSVDLQPCWQA